jgi:hypothetical protein
MLRRLPELAPPITDLFAADGGDYTKKSGEDQEKSPI